MQSFVATTVFQKTRQGREALLQTTGSDLNKEMRMMLHLVDGERNLIKLYAGATSLPRQTVDTVISSLFERGLIRELVIAAAVEPSPDGQAFNADQLEYFTDHRQRETEVLEPKTAHYPIDDYSDQYITRAKIEVASDLLPLDEPAQSVTLIKAEQDLVFNVNVSDASNDVLGSATYARSRMLGQASSMPVAMSNTRKKLWIRIAISILLLTAMIVVLLRK